VDLRRRSFLLLCLFALTVLVTAGCGSSGSGAKPSRGEDSSATAQSDRVITAGSDYTCALISGGTVECWGENEYGELGNGKAKDSLIPVAVMGITNASAISASGFDTCALISGGTVECWGENDYGQLGDGVTSHGFEENIEETDYSPIPVMVKGITNASAVSTGFGHSCALLSDNKVECWGSNSSGALGDG